MMPEVDDVEMAAALNYVYFIGPMPGHEGPVKIGRTGDLRQRLRAIQTACPTPLECFEFVEIDPREAGPLERCLHRVLSHRRLSGEWFNISRDDVYRAVQTAFNLLGHGKMIVVDHDGRLPERGQASDGPEIVVAV